MTFISAAGSRTGRGRRINQDAGYAGARLLAVADGDGEGGEIAAALVIDALRVCDTEMPTDALVTRLRDAVGQARERIRTLSGRHRELTGMGTAFTALVSSGDDLALADFGITQAHMLRESELFQITSDEGSLQVCVVEPDPQGMRPTGPVLNAGTDREPSIMVRKARPGDRYLLCCEALSFHSDVMDRYEVLMTEDDPAVAVSRLLGLVMANGHEEDVTCVVADVTDAPTLNPPMLVAAGASLPGT
ncbi:PP2C family protein-serine/threonine phosphatase [Actinomadura sp. HBU206391]|uniref:PP2C family protein-serine/threonine phosphatase n=1 Tax=Actinomadura sp. HBU206391 TaxID=2731692 RepID=UPI001650659C|nr:serine/threonine-protein phosphatase [Actinomadura sp. HBU206391]MBC6457933.1 serine/threonine-protein phosphatase [Actinomadura sp. HBU206391]